MSTQAYLQKDQQEAHNSTCRKSGFIWSRVVAGWGLSVVVVILFKQPHPGGESSFRAHAHKPICSHLRKCGPAGCTVILMLCFLLSLMINLHTGSSVTSAEVAENCAQLGWREND